MKHAIIVSHPKRRSFTMAMAKTYESALGGLDHSTALRDLYRMRFDPRLHAGEVPDAHGFSARPDVLAERKLLDDADVFAFFYPVWFNAPPAIHKGYIERVFGMGFGYGAESLGGNTQLLEGRRMITFSSSGAPMEWVRQTGAWDALRKLFDEHFANVCGLTVVDHVHFGGITSGLTSEQMTLHADRVRAKVLEHF